MASPKDQCNEWLFVVSVDCCALAHSTTPFTPKKNVSPFPPSATASFGTHRSRLRRLFMSTEPAAVEMGPPVRRQSGIQKRESAAAAGGDDAHHEAVVPKKRQSYLQSIGAAPAEVPASQHVDPSTQVPRSPAGVVRSHSGLAQRTLKQPIKDDEVLDDGIQWHSLTLEELTKTLSTHLERGLTSQEAAEAEKIHGKNAITPPPKESIIVKFFKTLLGGFQIMLIVGGFLCFIVVGIQGDDPQNLALGLMLIFVVLFSTIFQVYQEGKSDNTIEALRALTAEKVYCLRDGGLQFIPSANLVPGDIVHVKGGEKVPADVRVLSGLDLKVNNASLTGENMDIKLGPEAKHRRLFEAKNIARSGCNFTNGSGVCVVVATGDKTFFGTIAAAATQIERPPTLLRREINRLILIMTGFALALGITFLILALFSGYTWIEAITFAIGIIVANVPEGLLPQLTVALTITANRLKDVGCLISNLEIVETLGAVTVICSDKTGTLTQNRMTSSHVMYDGELFELPTVTRLPTDTIAHRDESNASYKMLLEIAALNSEAMFMAEEANVPVASWTVKGDATEAGILKTCQLEFNVATYRKEHQRRFLIPFNSFNKYMLAIHDSVSAANGKPDEAPLRVMVKGAPSRVFEMCTTALVHGEEVPFDKEYFERLNEELARRGERVLAFAQRIVDRSILPPGYVFEADPEPNFPADHLTLVGFISLVDPPRASVAPAIELARKAHVQVIMVTGDHPTTAHAIGKSLGLISLPTAAELKAEGKTVADDFRDAIVVHGSDMLKFNQVDWDFVLQHKEIIFARTIPQQKQDIVLQLHKLGHIVAMTGDGVNDAPALKAANVGIAMGSGTAVAKEASQVTLLDDDFGAIVLAVREGRMIFDGLKKCVAYVLSSNVPEIIPFLVFIVARIPLAIETIVILTIDLGTDIMPAVALAYEEPEDAIMNRPPRTNDDHLVGARLVIIAYFTIGVFQTFCSYFAFFYCFIDRGFATADMWGYGIGFRSTMDRLTSEQVVRFRELCARNTVYNSTIPMNVTTLVNGQNVTTVQQVRDCDGGFRNYRHETLSQAQAAFFITIVYGQMANAWIRKTMIATCLDAWRNYSNRALLLSFVVEFILMMLLTHVPGLNSTFLMAIPSSKHATVGLWVIPLIMIWDEVRKFICRLSGPGHWFTIYSNI